jgi:hypothetical protein
LTRFVYISDTHWGSGDSGYTMQAKYDQQLPAILLALQSWISDNGPVDFILHGGDVIHETTEAGILRAAELFADLPPMHLCLGNHDLTTEAARDLWLRLAPQFFPTASSDFAIPTNDCMIHVMPNQYGDTPYHWNKTQDSHFLPAQIERLEQRLHEHADTTPLLVTHSPIHAVGTSQSGLAEPFHVPPASFTRTVTGLAEKHHIPCILGGHSHVNMNRLADTVNYITASSLVEVPFEFKLFEVQADSISMQTHNLLERVSFRTAYNFDQTFVQGRACDRAFEKSL